MHRYEQSANPNWAEPEAHFAQPHAIGASVWRPQPVGHSAHMLLIDAHEANLRVLQEVLEESGYVEAGCVDTLPKPVRAPEVLARVAIHLCGHHLAAQARQARQALSAFGHVSLVLRARGGARIWHTLLASQLMQFHFEASDVVTPPNMLRWLRQLLSSDTSVSTLISARAGHRLELSLHGQTGQTGDDDWLVVMRETSDAVLI